MQRESEGDGNDGLGDGEVGSVNIWVVHMVPVLCLMPITC